MGNCILTKSTNGLIGIDIDNVIAQNPTTPYIATQDCFIQGFVNNGAHIYIQNSSGTNKTIVACNNALLATFPVKKGQVVTKEGNADLSYVYGLK